MRGGRRVLTIVEPGMFTTVQDLGRFGHRAAGVAWSGAADGWSLRMANRLLGNPEGAAGLECTLVGPTIRFETDTVVCVAGARCPEAAAGRGGNTRTLAWCRPERVAAGESVRIGRLSGGARCAVGVRGGIAVDAVMGSRSTLVGAGFGGFEGRALRAGDAAPLGRDTVGPACDDPRVLDRAERWLAGGVSRRVLRVTPGPAAEAAGSAALAGFVAEAWSVSERSDRSGVRLEGRSLRAGFGAGSMASEGTIPGAVQVPGDGRPIVLGVDGPTTGGYPVIASVIAADVHLLGLVGPRETVRFEMVTHHAARAAWVRQEAGFAAVFSEGVGV
jgi:biotin-dependent carboxylase-like uncharacterized protein